MWASSFEGFWLLAHRNKQLAAQPVTRALLAVGTLTCREVGIATDRLSPHMLRDIGLHEQCECAEGFDR